LFWVNWIFLEDYFLPFFSPMRYASAKSQEMKAPFINNLPMPTNDVMVNPIHPENPDSKPVAAAHIISTDDGVSSIRFGGNVYSIIYSLV
jgi:hypothetical protein